VHVVFGIGNPGPEYDGTRHNLGFRVVDALSGGPLADLGGLRAVGRRVRLAGRPVLLVKPLTYVNLCGPVLEAIRRREDLPLDRLLAVVDDLAIPLGTLRLRARGSDGGHKGLRSLVEHLGTEAFPRLRIGIGDGGGAPAEEYVLERFPPAEAPLADAAVLDAAEAVRLWVRAGLEAAASVVNRRRDLDPEEGGA
jgi:PTH1 family peptidyl-tRNA hydrolase